MRWIVQLVLVAALAVVGSARAQETRPGIAVLPLENGGSYGKDKDEFEALRKGLAAMLSSELSLSPAARVIDRHQIQKLLDEQGLATLNGIDAQTAARLGKLVGARYVVAGTFVDLYGDFRIDARIIDVETGEIIKVVRGDPGLTDRVQMFRIIQSVSLRILERVKLPPPPAQSVRSRNIPTEALAYFSRALFYQDKGDRQRALESYQQAIRIFPDYAEALEGLKRLRTS